MSSDEFKKKSDELLYTVWSLVMVRNQLPAQVVKTHRRLSGQVSFRRNSTHLHRDTP